MKEVQTVLAGQYRLLEKISEGGMGVIYKAEHLTLGQVVSIKVLHPELKTNADYRDRFLNEARIQAKLIHHNIVKLLNFFEFEDSFYLVMEYIEGESLSRMIRTKGPPPLKQTVAIFKQIAEGLYFAHLKGVIHRDIKPGNILINLEQTVKITDFGIAKFSREFNKSTSGEKSGTLVYMSPERIRGESLGVTADIYSLGVTFYEVITGQNPFRHTSEYKIIKSILEGEFPPPRALLPSIPPHIEQAVIKALSKRPEDRFPTALEFSKALQVGAYRQPAVNIGNETRDAIARPIASILDLGKGWGISSLGSNKIYLGLLALMLFLIGFLGGYLVKGFVNHYHPFQ